MGIALGVGVFIAGVLGYLLCGISLDFIELFIPKIIFEGILVVTLMMWAQWMLKSTIKEAILEAINDKDKISDEHDVSL